MTKASTTIDERQTAEARRLSKLFAERSGGLTQEEFGSRYNIGSQGMMWQLLNGRRPLSLKSAVGFAKGLNVPLEQISEAIADEVKEASRLIAELDSAGKNGEVPGAEAKSGLPASRDRMPDYVKAALDAVLSAYELGAPREAFDSVRILLGLLKTKHSGKTTAYQKDEAAKPPTAMQSIQREAEQVKKEAESRLATRTEDARGSQRIGAKRSRPKNIRH